MVPAAMCVLVLAAPATALASARGGTGGAPTDPLVVASLAPETGSVGEILDSLRTPVRLAVDEINSAGGVNGAPVTLVTGDDGTEPEIAATTVARFLDTDGAQVIIGPSTSEVALSLLDDVKRRALMCSGSNVDDRLTRAGPRRSGGQYFRTLAPHRLQAPALAQLVLADDRRRPVILVLDNGVDRAFARQVQRTLKSGGARTAPLVEYTFEGAVESSVAAALAKKPDAVIIVGGAADGAEVVRELVARGAPAGTMPTYVPDTLQRADFGEVVDATNPVIVAGIKGVASATAPGGTDSPFGPAFAQLGVDPIFSAHYYDCTVLAALAAVASTSTDPSRMAEAFRANLTGENDCAGFAECKALLERGRSIHYRGASSRFDAFGAIEPETGTYDVWSYGLDALPRTDPLAAQITVG